MASETDFRLNTATTLLQNSLCAHSISLSHVSSRNASAAQLVTSHFVEISPSALTFHSVAVSRPQMNFRVRSLDLADTH